MRKAVFLFVVLSMFLFAGCGALSDAVVQTGQTTPTAAPAASAEPSPTQVPTPVLIPVPAATPSPATIPEVNEEARFSVDLDGDGKDDMIVVGSEEESEAIYLDISDVGEHYRIIVDYGWFTSAFMTRTGNGDVCLFASIDMASEDYITYIYAFDGLEPVLQCNVGEYVYNVEGVDITMSDMVDAIGSWDYTCEFELTDEFILVQLSDMKIIQNWREPLLTKRELPVEMFMGGEYVADTLALGTKVYPLSTDGESYLCFSLDDGSEGRINFTREGSYCEAYIDGISESEYFEHIEYSD